MTKTEQAVIGTLLVNNGEDLPRIIGFLKPEHFSDKYCRNAYTCILSYFNQHAPVSFSAVMDWLKNDGEPDEIIEEELRCCLYCASDATLESDAKTVYKSWQVKEFNNLLQQKRTSFENVETDIARYISDLQALVEQDHKSKILSLAEVAEKYMDSYFCPKDDPPIRLPFPELDKLIGGLEKGDIMVIGARPGVGKSAFVAQLALSLSQNNKRIGLYSMEMRDKLLYERFLAMASGIKMDDIRNATKFDSDETKAAFDRGNELLLTKTNFFLSEGVRSVSEIRAEIQYMNYDLLIIDYLQLVKTEGKYKGNRYAEVGEVSHALKGMAMEFNIPVIALSQLNRNSAGYDAKPPTMSDMRESGDIEQDASVIILLWDKDPTRINKGCKIEKNRQGRFGETEMRYNGALMQFTDESGFVPPLFEEGFSSGVDVSDLPWI